MEVFLHVVMSSALDEGEWAASYSGYFSRRGRECVTRMGKIKCIDRNFVSKVRGTDYLKHLV
jgi:hypothetical protein